MTKNEAKILEFVKSNETAEQPVATIDIFNNFLKRDKIPAVKTEDRVNVLLRFGYISSKPLDDYVRLTPIGLHALDEYIENQTRLDKAEKDSKIARRNACIANVLAAASLIATAGYLKPLIEKFLSHMLP